MTGRGASPRIEPARWIFGLFGLSLFVLLLWVGGPLLLERLASVAPGWLAAAFGVTGVLTALTARRWALLTDVFLDAPDTVFLAYYRSFLLGRVLSLVIPSGVADLAARPALHRWLVGAPLAAAAQGSILARIVDASLLAPLGGLSLVTLALPVSRELYLGLFAITMAAWLVLYLAFTSRIVKLLGAVLLAVERRAGRWPRLADWVGSGRRSLGVAANDRNLLESIGLLSAVRYLLIVGEFYLVARALGVSAIGWTELLIGIPLAQILAAIAVTPAGLGFQEGGLWGALRVLGASAREASAYLVGWRLLHSAFILALAAIVTPLTLMRSYGR